MNWYLEVSGDGKSKMPTALLGRPGLNPIIELDPGSYLLIAKINGVEPYSRDHDDLVLKLARTSDWKHIKTVNGDIRSSMSAPKVV